MNPKQKHPDYRHRENEITKLLSDLDLTESLLLLDCLQEVQFWIKDALGRYLRVNRTFQLDYSLGTVSEAIGKTDYDLSPPWIAEAFRANGRGPISGSLETEFAKPLLAIACRNTWVLFGRIQNFLG